MGLDLWDDNGNRLSMGRYSGVHVRRKYMLEAAALHIATRLAEVKDRKAKLDQEDDDLEYDEDLDENIDGWITMYEKDLEMLRMVCQPSDGGSFRLPLSYANFPQMPTACMIREGLAGVFWFCHFSDCDGVYSPGMVSDIADAFAVLKPLFATALEQYDLEEDYFVTNADFFHTAASQKSKVTLC